MNRVPVDAPTVQALLGVEDCIERYISERRSRIGSFVDRHFSLESTVALRKRSFSTDVWCYPVNTLWSVPYLFMKKAGETFEKLGWKPLSDTMGRIPAGLRSAYHREVESMVRREILDLPSLGQPEPQVSHPLMTLMEQDPRVVHLLDSAEFKLQLRAALRDIDALVQAYGASRSLVSDTAGSVMTVALGYFVFGDHALGIQGMGERIAAKRAREKAVSSFAFGSTVGSAFYSVFPPKPSMWEVMAATAALGLVLTLSGIVIGMVYDPLLKRIGWHSRELHGLLDSIEDRLYLLRKRLKPLLLRSVA